MLRAAFQSLKSKFGRKVTLDSSTIDVSQFKVVQEGDAKILFPNKETVFYNPIQQFNRDLSVTCIKAWDELYQEEQRESRELKSKNKKRKPIESNEDGSDYDTIKRRKLNEDQDSVAVSSKDHSTRPYIKILEALSATGLRAIRYSKEVPNVKTIVANDLLPEAVESIKRNVIYNEVSDKVVPNLDDANVLMYRNKSKNEKYHVIDLDPYGTVTPFVDASMQSIEDGGLMLVTCTDLSVLAGNGYPEKCFALYSGVNMAGHDATHESALRLVLNLLGQSAAKYKKTIEPLLSLSIDFYVRVFIRVKTSPIEVKNLQSNTMVGYMCSGCNAYHTQPLGRQQERTTKKGVKFTKFSLAQGPPVDRNCSYCGSVHHIVGPMYGGPLHNKKFIDRVLRINKEEHKDDIYGTRKRIEGMLTLAKNEIAAPFYFTPNSVSSVLKFQVPTLKAVVAGLGSLGFECSLTHAKASSLKTDASWDAIWYVMKKYCIDNNLVNIEKMNKNGNGYKILTNDTIGQTEDWDKKISFEPNEYSGRFEKLRKLKIVRYQENPTKNWGPKARPQ
ncbi:tRNA (guanine26-N2)-dimethyltransferase [Kluyveromyces lactis]|uniref:tRNA (guanine(26)-N(2))-dimethyltransferase n=1 Tax=Kluyveromyces lactis (strain ATCC 8585 / CBS 2359 / DSM 70799 / NBRC 1267 / NRRL Y-1140 / WM37) TaxID=284590 RepID=Q6CJD8_KLULA|nr:uncharacterized protein KLLA0_F19404g [Kluyveromyces lactis]CAG98659.1 KLLA0F19404p [Kluyveromyces lactis]|eukprot:XP_455951.1 uncharacterized protein KLLA0_F19404g [Kluyveromyces lactis]